MRTTTVVLLGGVLLSLTQAASAVPVESYARPVAAIGSNTVVGACASAGVGDGCYDAASGEIGFYIPINDRYTGTYGVDVRPDGRYVGTASDSVSGTFAETEALTMFLWYSPIAFPAEAATLAFHFEDLDLADGNDPVAFFETIQFFEADGDTLSGLIDSFDDDTGNIQVTGDGVTQSIVFNDVTDYIESDSFWVALTFGSAMSRDGNWRNTAESMTSTLLTTPRDSLTSVAEPGSLALLAGGILAGGLMGFPGRGARRRRG